MAWHSVIECDHPQDRAVGQVSNIVFTTHLCIEDVSQQSDSKTEKQPNHQTQGQDCAEYWSSDG